MAKKAKKKAAKAVAKRIVRKPASKAVATRIVRKPATKAAKPRAAKARATKPGFSFVSVFPGFTVNDAEASVTWYRDVLGFSVKEKWEHEGRFVGAEMSSGGVSFNLGQDDWKLGRDRIKGQGTRQFITTSSDIDGLAAQIKARGGSLDHGPVDEWGVRAFGITDPDGYKLTFMTPLKKR